MKATYFFKRSGICSVLVFLTLMASWGALFTYSAVQIDAIDVLTALLNHDSQNIRHVIVQEIRLPRVLVAILVGASLATAGMLMQGVTRNPLASPSLFGVNTGAALGVALVSTFWVSSSLVSMQLAAIIGGASAWTLVMLLGGAWKTGSERGQLILSGIAISSFCGALTKASLILVEDQASSVISWLAGSFANVRWDTWQWSWPCLSLGLVLSLLITPKLNLLSMGDERVKSFGVNLGWLRISVGFVVFILVGISVSAVGVVAFLGLIVPQIARLLVGYDYRIMLPVCMLLGALFTVTADLISRGIVYPTETPAGAVLALIGAPYFLYLVRGK